MSANGRWDLIRLLKVNIKTRQLWDELLLKKNPKEFVDKIKIVIL